MRRIYLIAAVALLLSALILAYSQSPQPGTRSEQKGTAGQQFTIERQVTTQQRINRYFHGDVVPKLKNCWSTVRGKGTIALKYTYTKAGGKWMFSRLETDRSTLPSGQGFIAQKCMLDAVRGTSFPVDGAESTENTFVVSWNWPVPFPANAAQLTGAMFAARANNSGGGGGCDGQGTPAKCHNCSVSGGTLSCATVCVGYKDCSLTTYASGNKVCGAEYSGACASGGPFGVSGSRIIY